MSSVPFRISLPQLVKVRGGGYRKIYQVIWENEMKLSDTALFISELLCTK